MRPPRGPSRSSRAYRERRYYEPGDGPACSLCGRTNTVRQRGGLSLCKMRRKCQDRDDRAFTAFMERYFAEHPRARGTEVVEAYQADRGAGAAAARA